MPTNKEILLVKRPETEPTEEHIKIQETAFPSAQEGEIVVRMLYASVDPYMRGRMNDGKSYIAPFELNKPMEGGVIAQVEESRVDGFQKGEIVMGSLPWKKYAAVKPAGLRKVDPSLGPVTTSLGVLGMPGLTAYFGLMHIGKPKDRETVVVSGAAGAVGATVVQLAKIAGARVVGIAGTQEKVKYVKETLGADASINYKTEDVSQALKTACPDGVDIYYDNVGGEIADAIFPLLNKFARIVQCGAISTYNTPDDHGPRIQNYLIKSSALMQGFTVGDFQKNFKEGLEFLSKWVKDGELKYEETITEGFEQIPQAFFGLFTGDNKGKQLVKVSEIE